MTHFMGADRVARVGAVRSAMRASTLRSGSAAAAEDGSGKRRNAPPGSAGGYAEASGAPIRPTRRAGRF